MELPKVSAIITTHNRLGLLKRAIESVKKQTYSNIECIVVSDNSSDGTDDYCSSLEGIEFISIPQNESKGGNYARNLGIKKAIGEYVAFLDDDDYWKPTKIEKQVALAKEKNCGYIYCGVTREHVGDTGVFYTDHIASPIYDGDVSKKILTSIFTTTSELLIKRDLLIQAGMFDEKLKFWQEYELSIRLAQLTDFYCLREPLTIYRTDEGDGNRLTNKYSGWIESVRYVHTKHKKLYATLSFKEKYALKQFVWQEAISRCKSAGLRTKECYYSTLLWLSCLPKRIKHL